LKICTVNLYSRRIPTGFGLFAAAHWDVISLRCKHKTNTMWYLY